MAKELDEYPCLEPQSEDLLAVYSAGTPEPEGGTAKVYAEDWRSMYQARSTALPEARLQASRSHIPPARSQEVPGAEKKAQRKAFF